MKKMWLVFLCCVCSSGCAYVSYMHDPFVDIPAFAQVTDTIYRGGAPKPAGYERLQSLGIQSILNLSQDTKQVGQEEPWARARGIEFYNIPIDLYVRPSDEQALRFLEIVLKTAKRPLFIHCEDGRDRTGTMVALYRVAAEGWTIKQAYTEARKIGYWPYHGDEAPLKAFMHQLKDNPLYFKRAKELMNAEN
ncbi:MAG TPA: tyrosine-protein phosphatase [Candidatus Omnitrophota bacterium]|nr:tyrosine-protein phosphatase [Candidatus Omnitrophota bacterium]HNQ50996.1 tyrosine-protein phosphatase [Candidatus Omnitrophota bacterium]HQQ06475.1 tyrosine-protein phosphatase [Candidatus Omnitrophota bacterium]